MKRRSNTRVERALTATSGSSSLTLGGALKAFIDQSPLAHHAQISAVAAGDSNVSLTKQLCAFLVAHDFDATVIVGIGYVKSLVKPCPKLVEEMRESSEAKVAYNLQHAVVKVGGLVFDLTFLRLGDTYSHLNNFTVREFYRYFREVKDMKHLMSITPDHARELARKADNGWTMGRRMSLAVTMNAWRLYTSPLPLTIRTRKGKAVRFSAGDHFSILTPKYEYALATVHHVEFPDVPLSVKPEILALLTERSRSVLSAPTAALRAPKMIRVDLTKPTDTPSTATP